jgi:hypothetical protein
MRFNIVVATHHKTGTVWMVSVFKAIAKGLGARYVDFWSHYGRLDRQLRTPFVLFNYDSTFLQHSDVLGRDDVRILHLIRDPRDVLISAMNYHKTSDEAWLHETVPGDDGITYQSKLNSFSTPFEQYLFELENSTNSAIEAMLDWQYDRANCLEARYEDLRLDHSMALWSQIVTFLGFEETEQGFCKDCFWQHSLFGGAAGANSKHVRSGDVAQWKREFTPELADAFIERFPDALQVLGYEPDDQWIERLGEAGRVE